MQDKHPLGIQKIVVDRWKPWVDMHRLGVHNFVPLQNKQNMDSIIHSHLNP